MDDVFVIFIIVPLSLFFFVLVSFVCFVFIVLLFLSFSCLSASFYLLSFFLFPCRWRLLLLPVADIFPYPPFCLPFSLVLLVLFVYICLVTLVYSLFFNFRSLCFLSSVYSFISFSLLFFLLVFSSSFSDSSDVEELLALLRFSCGPSIGLASSFLISSLTARAFRQPCVWYLFVVLNFSRVRASLCLFLVRFVGLSLSFPFLPVVDFPSSATVAGLPASPPPVPRVVVLLRRRVLCSLLFLHSPFFGQGRIGLCVLLCCR